MGSELSGIFRVKVFVFEYCEILKRILASVRLNLTVMLKKV